MYYQIPDNRSDLPKLKPFMGYKCFSSDFKTEIHFHWFDIILIKSQLLIHSKYYWLENDLCKVTLSWISSVSHIRWIRIWNLNVKNKVKNWSKNRSYLTRTKWRAVGWLQTKICTPRKKTNFSNEKWNSIFLF